MKTLRQAQSEFAQLVARLIQEAARQGFDVTLGECWRSPEEAARHAAQGTGIARSLHRDRLAIDLNLFKDGEWLKTTEAHTTLGEWWEQQHPKARWGGRFARADGNHYELQFP